MAAAEGLCLILQQVVVGVTLRHH